MKFDIKNVLMFAMAALLAFLAIYKIFSKEEITVNDDKVNDEAVFDVTVSDEVEVKLYYESDRKYYLYGLDEVMVTYKNETKTLKSFLSDGVSIEDLVSHMETNAFYDGGTNLYRDDTTAVLVCHRIIGNGTYNENVYIGKSSMGFEEGFCR